MGKQVKYNLNRIHFKKNKCSQKYYMIMEYYSFVTLIFILHMMIRPTSGSLLAHPPQPLSFQEHPNPSYIQNKLHRKWSDIDQASDVGSPYNVVDKVKAFEEEEQEKQAQSETMSLPPNDSPDFNNSPKSFKSFSYDDILDSIHYPRTVKSFGRVSYKLQDNQSRQRVPMFDLLFGPKSVSSDHKTKRSRSGDNNYDQQNQIAQENSTSMGTTSLDPSSEDDFDAGKLNGIEFDMANSNFDEDLTYELIKPNDLRSAFSTKPYNRKPSGECSIRLLEYRAVKTDEYGNSCSADIRIKVCSGGCPTGEIGVWKIPFKKSLHSTCNFVGRTPRIIQLNDCTSPDVDESLRYYHVIEPNNCTCKNCDPAEAHCLTTLRRAV